MAYVLRLLLLMLAMWLIRRGVVYLRGRLLRVAQPGQSRSPWEILGLDPGADAASVEAAWRRLIQENHPDRVTHMDPEIQALAATRTQAINEAYEVLRHR